MNGNQITISVNTADLDQLRAIARTRGQSVSDYVARLVSSNLEKSAAVSPPSNTLSQEARSAAK